MLQTLLGHLLKHQHHLSAIHSSHTTNPPFTSPHRIYPTWKPHPAIPHSYLLALHFIKKHANAALPMFPLHFTHLPGEISRNPLHISTNTKCWLRCSSIAMDFCQRNSLPLSQPHLISRTSLLPAAFTVIIPEQTLATFCVASVTFP